MPECWTLINLGTSHQHSGAHTKFLYYLKVTFRTPSIDWSTCLPFISLLIFVGGSIIDWCPWAVRRMHLFLSEFHSWCILPYGYRSGWTSHLLTHNYKENEQVVRDVQERWKNDESSIICIFLPLRIHGLFFHLATACMLMPRPHRYYRIKIIN